MTIKTIKINNLADLEKMSTLGFTIQDEIEDSISKEKNIKGWVITATNEQDRTLEMNNLLWSAWYPAITKVLRITQDENITIEQVSSRCKRKFGIGLMRQQAATNKKVKRELLRFGLISEDQETSNNGWKVLMPISIWPLEAQLEALVLMDCTKNFTIKLFSEYLERIQIWAAQEHNIVLESINESKMLESYQC